MPIKRPRGRPPISAKRKYEAMISVAPASRVQPHAVHYFEPAPHNSSIESSKLNASVFESDKVTADGVTKKVVSVLMTDGPLNLADLARAIPETSKESIQSIVDVLQVLGIVVKLLSKDGGKSTAFSLTSWTRGAEAVEFSKVQEDAEKRLSNLVSVQKRILILQARKTAF